MKVSLPMSQEFPLVECKNPDCGAQFILFFVIFPEKIWEEIRFCEQAGVYFCPYCGKKQ